MNGRQPFAAMDVAAGWLARTLPVVGPEYWIDIDPFNSILCANSESDVQGYSNSKKRKSDLRADQPLLINFRSAPSLANRNNFGS
jgi:hypothetical protein